MHGQIREQTKRIWNRGYAPRFRSLSHIKHLYDFTLMIAEEGEISAQASAKCSANFRGIDAGYGEMAVIDGKLFLQFDEVAQLHLAFASPVAAIEGENKGKFPDQLRKLDWLAILIRELD